MTKEQKYNSSYYQEHKDAISARAAKYYQEHKEEIKASQTEYRQKRKDGYVPKWATCHPDRPHWAKGLCQSCYTRNWEAAHPIHTLYVERQRTQKIKIEVLSHYSPNGILGCCWEGCTVSDLDMLSLDHIDNDGAEHRRHLKCHGGFNTYQAVRNADYPQGFQTLCMNHQQKKRLEYERLSKPLRGKDDDYRK